MTIELSEYVIDAIANAIVKKMQEPILDKIKAEIKEKFEGCDICEWFEDYDYDENDISEYQPVGSIDMVLEIIDKYKAEVGSQESEET